MTNGAGSGDCGTTRRPDSSLSGSQAFAPLFNVDNTMFSGQTYKSAEEPHHQDVKEFSRVELTSVTTFEQLESRLPDHREYPHSLWQYLAYIRKAEGGHRSGEHDVVWRCNECGLPMNFLLLDGTCCVCEARTECSITKHGLSPLESMEHDKYVTMLKGDFSITVRDPGCLKVA